MKNLNFIFAFIYFASLVLSSPIPASEESALEDPAVDSNEAYTVSTLEDCESSEEIEIKGNAYVVDDEDDCLSGDEIIKEDDAEEDKAEKNPETPAG